MLNKINTRTIARFTSVFLMLMIFVSMFGLSFNISNAAATGLVPCNPTFSGTSGSTANADLTDPCGWEQLVALGQNILNYAIVLMAILSVAGIAYAGFLYVTAMGDSSKIKKAHGIFTKIIWGIFFVLGAYLIVNTLLKGLGFNENKDATGWFQSFLI